MAQRRIFAPFPKDKTLRANFETEHLLWCKREVNAFFSALLAQQPEVFRDLDARNSFLRFITPTTPSDMNISGNKKVIKKLPWKVSSS